MEKIILNFLLDVFPIKKIKQGRRFSESIKYDGNILKIKEDNILLFSLLYEELSIIFNINGDDLKKIIIHYIEKKY
jgi:hypothetical protein